MTVCNAVAKGSEDVGGDPAEKDPESESEADQGISSAGPEST